MDARSDRHSVARRVNDLFYKTGASRSAATRGTCPLRHGGTCPLRHASRPSLARSVADVLSAQGLREQVPHITAGFGGSKMIGNRDQLR